MYSFASRACRWQLALTLIALAACADEPPVGPKNLRLPTPSRTAGVPVIMVTNKSGGTGEGSLRWAASSGLGATSQFDPSLAGYTIPLWATLVINSNKTIEGPADKGITIRSASFGRVIHVPNGASLRLRNVTV